MNLKNLKIRSQQRYDVQRKNRVNFNENDPILIAKAAPIESYWTQIQHGPSKIIIDANSGERKKEIQTQMRKPDSNAGSPTSSRDRQAKKQEE